MVKSPTWRALIGLLSGVILDTLLRFSQLLNEVWGLKGYRGAIGVRLGVVLHDGSWCGWLTALNDSMLHSNRFLS